MECIKIILYGFNVLFWLMGAAMMGVGIWLAVDPGALDASAALESGGLNNDLWSIGIYIFIAVGALVFIVGFIGCWGACVSSDKSNPLWIYSVLTGLAILAEATVIILVALYWGYVDDDNAIKMQQDLQTLYNGENSSDSLSSSWNAMQQQWDCCGSYNYTDYTTAGISVPSSCCDVGATSCQITDPINVYTQGCYYALRDYLDEKTPIVMGLACAAACLQVIGLILACCLIHRRKTKDIHL